MFREPLALRFYAIKLHLDLSALLIAVTCLEPALKSFFPGSPSAESGGSSCVMLLQWCYTLLHVMLEHTFASPELQDVSSSTQERDPEAIPTLKSEAQGS